MSSDPDPLEPVAAPDTVAEPFRSEHLLLHADALAGVRRLPRESVHLIVTSPPYPMIQMWDEVFSRRSEAVEAALLRGDGAEAFGAMHAVLDPVWEELRRVLIPGGIACINIGDAVRTVGGEFRMFTNRAALTAACERVGFRSLPAILWRKATNAPNKFMGSGMLPAGAYVTLEHEYILIFRKGGPRAFSGSSRLRRRQSALFWEERNRWFVDLWSIPGLRQGRGGAAGRLRSAAYPIEIPYRLVAMFSVAGDTVLDPYVGTGATTIAAGALGRSSIGIDCDSELIEGARRRAGGLIETGVERASRRLVDHRAFIAERGKPVKHHNARYDVPVVTGQETDIVVTEPESYHLCAPHRILVRHRPRAG